jgi:glycine/D-amino acid oxidase-like deaminating enzyme
MMSPMPTLYGRSPWVDQFPKSRIPAYPRPKTLPSVDVAIIGGGLTGCATAYAFAAAGIKVALFEADRLGRGSSGASTGWIADEPGARFAEVEKLIGLRAARHAWQSWRRAALDFSSLLKRLDIKCHLTPAGTLTAALTAEQAVALKREQKARKDAGLDAALVNASVLQREAGVAGAAAIRSRDGALLDPYRATLGLAAAAAARGALIFEQSPIARITFTRKYADMVTPAGPLRLQRIIVATGMPTQLFKSLRRHFWFRSAYFALTEPVPAKIRQKLGERQLVVRDAAVPPHTIRWVGGERLLVGGADIDTPKPRQAMHEVVARSNELMYELSTIYPDISGIMPAYGWESPFSLTAEGLPYLGPHRNFPFHLFAFGDSSASVTGAYLASRVLLRHHLGENDAADDAFGFHR